MEIIGRMEDMSEVHETNKDGQGFSQKALDKYDKLFGDDGLERFAYCDKLIPELKDSERENKFYKLFDGGDFFKNSENGNITNKTECAQMLEVTDTERKSDNWENRTPNFQYVIDENKFETDDDGLIYKKNDKLLPNIEYTVNGNIYKTDGYGNKISCDSNPEYTEKGIRNVKEQMEAGGEERQEDDEGGHIIARILGGAEGDENLVPMRRTINRGDYKKMENEIVSALRDGKEASIHIDLDYVDDSQRPSKIKAEYIIDGKNMIVEFDNKKNSIELLESLNQKISAEDYINLREEIEDMKDDRKEVSITSVKTEYDEGGDPVKIMVGVLDEAAGEKTYKVYEPR